MKKLPQILLGRKKIKSSVPSLKVFYLQPLKTMLNFSIAIALGLISVSALSGTLEQAKRMHDRLAGVPPSPSVLANMKADLDAGNAMAAAEKAMANDNFYNVTVKHWAAPWTNREGDMFVPLNDYIATVVGFVKEGATMDFRQMLYADVIYIGDPALGLPAYANNNNAHYEALESAGHSLQTALVQRPQSSITGLPADATAGVVTSRAAARSFFKAGTNRANFRFTLLNHLCVDLEQVQDTTGIPDRIRQDVSRSPGGDGRVFLNNCIACHTGMDPLAQAFAYYDYNYDADNDLSGANGMIEYNTEGTIEEETGSRVQPKYHINSATFPFGFVTPDDRWDNYWRKGPNRSLGWDESLPGRGNGARTMLQELAHSEAFAECQVKKVFKTVCLREPDANFEPVGGVASNDATQVAAMVNSFKASGYNIRTVFAESADYCKGE